MKFERTILSMDEEFSRCRLAREVRTSLSCVAPTNPQRTLRTPSSQSLRAGESHSDRQTKTALGWGFADADQHLYGLAWLYGVESASKHPPAETFLGYRSLCPFLCELAPVGFVEWVEFSEFQRASWLLPLIKVGKGLLVEISQRTLRPCVIERVFSLDNLGSKFGFEDGDVLLTRSMDDLQGYRARTAEAIEKTLAEHGLDLHVYGPEWTSHNISGLALPLRTRQGETIEEEGKITCGWPQSKQRSGRTI